MQFSGGVALSPKDKGQSGGKKNLKSLNGQKAFNFHRNRGQLGNLVYYRMAAVLSAFVSTEDEGGRC